MPNSLRSKIKHLAYKGEFNESERDRLLSALDHEIDVTYICDGKKCPECSKPCNHTTDISHAINFEPVMFIDGKTILNYEEKLPKDERVGCEYCNHKFREQHERPCSLCQRNFADMFEREVNADGLKKNG